MERGAKVEIDVQPNSLSVSRLINMRSGLSSDTAPQKRITSVSLDSLSNAVMSETKEPLSMPPEYASDVRLVSFRNGRRSDTNGHPLRLSVVSLVNLRNGPRFDTEEQEVRLSIVSSVSVLNGPRSDT